MVKRLESPICSDVLMWGTWQLGGVVRFIHGPGTDGPFLFFTARVLEVSGREGLPRGRALRQSRHQHSWQRVPRGKIRTLFKVTLVSFVFGWELDESFTVSL